MDTMGCKVKHSYFPQEWNAMEFVLERDEEVTVWRQVPFKEHYWFESSNDMEALK